MRFTLKNLRFLQYIDYQNVRKTEFLGCQSQEDYFVHCQVICLIRLQSYYGQNERTIPNCWDYAPMDLAIIWYCPLQHSTSRKQFVEDLQGADVDG